MNINYLPANQTDAEAIAKLHALSWQRHYQGIYPQTYLDQEVVSERLKVWKQRFEKEDQRQYIIKAMDQNRIIGFICAYLNEDPVWGTLVDNLHVLREYQGNGIGKKLLQLTAEWVIENGELDRIHLFVLDKNTSAKTFYRNLGATLSEVFPHQNPAGTFDDVIRCSWIPSDLLR